ncbi:hypothetical protein Pan97_22700 [Bremerella volcania]|uniref:3-keto-alpha-glucoside-1,2-lyase/3-keto-2-hydroxy-glucal hydratase domain-containing protein n=1 Tax=Bremerella volcania TaxID=2527984 RepID=A0A518C7N9_9BACT|nr:DUF1080 domain-containing protein [Bremerella volcania]QDU75241.1 hypothetical protein Pan97_22700 [Bremerella volcania]
MRTLLASLLLGLLIVGPTVSVSAAESEEGFVSIFNGKNFDGWVGNTKGYKVEEESIVCDPTAGGGNIYTEKEYANFVLRFEFKLPPGANNGLGIRAPLQGNAAYNGYELQILDNTAKKYEKLKPYQYHGSLYGLAPAKRGHLKPIGEWNEQEVTVDGDLVKVVLNGTEILNVDLEEIRSKPTLDGSEHPGLKRSTGHIGFLGHGDKVEFRNLRIKSLPEMK